MSENESLIPAMADRCLQTIASWKDSGRDHPVSLRPEHLRWMCLQVRRHTRDWPATKLHRWIGFVQGAMIANHMITLDGAKVMFDDAKNGFGANDRDLVDHLDPDHDFELDIGGQG